MDAPVGQGHCSGCCAAVRWGRADAGRWGPWAGGESGAEPFSSPREAARRRGGRPPSRGPGQGLPAPSACLAAVWTGASWERRGGGVEGPDGRAGPGRGAPGRRCGRRSDRGRPGRRVGRVTGRARRPGGGGKGWRRRRVSRVAAGRVRRLGGGGKGDAGGWEAVPAARAQRAGGEHQLAVRG
ncbi:translation initiation factor IF-2-like [Panicum virgatum]|uniref:translation initiation factor IF-2-like n=1 Tax=Panicum virgatum TaxID=38727 RepID=UPI0019D5FC2D|nr:translation initiation factor IF-2-like [Panicum virgatum]